jgi:4-carboxymuconolactone decarboxylase
MMTQLEREDAYRRVSIALGVDRMGQSADAPALPPRRAVDGASTGTLPIEAEIAGIRMIEYGEFWGRPALGLRTRSFLTLAALQALGATDQLYRHVNIALNLGVTPEEIFETFLQASVYCGLPAYENAVAAANEVFLHRGIVTAGDGSAPTPLAPMPGPLTELMNDRGPVEYDLAMIGADHGFGEVWGRPGLDLRTRSFITMAVLQIKVLDDQLQIHVNNALNLGISQDDIHEALAHVGIYGGVSGWHNASNVAKHAFGQREKN